MIKFFEDNYLLSGFIALVGAGLIFYVSGLSFGVGGVGNNWIPMIYHLLAFFFFSLFLFIYFVRGRRKKFFVVGFLFAFAYAISDEIHQFFVPGRFCTLFDIFLDITGISFACVIYLILKYK